MPFNPFKDPEQERLLDREEEAVRRERDRDDRPSWREIDKVRDRSPHSDQARAPIARDTPRGQREAAAARAAAGQAMDALFARAPDARAASEAALARASTAGEREAALKGHLAAHGPPTGWEVLVACIDVKDEALVAEVLRAIALAAPGWEAGQKERAVQAIRSRAFTLAGDEARFAAREAFAAMRDS